MSLVEKALEKLRASGQLGSPAPRGRPAQVTERIGSAASGPADPHPAVSTPFTADQARRVVRIDERTLREARVLSPEDESRRAADEFRAIKREIIGVAFADTGDHSYQRRLVAMSSALAGDGKTHTCINLALSIARERDCSVVLIDADVAKPHVSQLLGVADEPGLIDLLASNALDVRSVLLPTDRSGLWVLPAGRRSELATELLASQRMRDVCAQLAALMPNSILLLDSPPILMTSEAVVLVAVAGQVLLVVKAGETPQHAVAEAIDKIGDRGRIRLVLNQADVRGLSSYYYGHWLSAGAPDQGGRSDISDTSAGRE